LRTNILHVLVARVLLAGDVEEPVIPLAFVAGELLARYPYLAVEGLAFIGLPLFWRTLQTPSGRNVLGWVVCTVESVIETG
jgi:hypothetical protein